MGRMLTPDESLPSVVSSVTSKWSKGSGGPAGDECQNLVPTREGGFFDEGEGRRAKGERGEALAFNARQDPDVWADRSRPIDTHGSTQAVAFSGRARGAEPAVNRPERPPHAMLEQTGALESVKPWNVAAGMAVRRLTPRECERLQGFTDDYTRIAWRGKAADECADGPRYKALGNSMAVPVMRWIGERIALVERLVPR